MIITKEDILRIAEPFEQMYGDMSNEILILMAEFIGQDIDEPIEVWQEKKIKQIQILLKMVRNIQKGYPYLRLINHALNETVDESLKEHSTIYPACGTSNSAIKLTIDELEEVVPNHIWINVSKEIK